MADSIDLSGRVAQVIGNFIGGSIINIDVIPVDDGLAV
jgi:hypothetical protein